MARKTVLLDDFDGSPLPDDTQPVRVSIGSRAYNLYLSEENWAKFEAAVAPFIEGAESATESQRTQTLRTAATSTRTSKAEKDRLKKVREWARTTGFKYRGADGQMRTLGERGRIPDEVIKAWEEAGEPS